MMTKSEAKLILEATRSEGIDDKLAAEALEFARNDADLSAWLEHTRAADEAIVGKLVRLVPPEGLREKILDQGKVVRADFTPRRRRRLLLAAAALVFFAVVASFFVIQEGGDVERYAEAMAENLDQLASLDLESADAASVKSWLQAGRAPADVDGPRGLVQGTRLGCKIYDWNGRKVSLICYRTGSDGEEAHLFLVDAAATSGLKENNIRLLKQGDWSIALWKKDGLTRLLATQHGMERLKELL